MEDVTGPGEDSQEPERDGRVAGRIVVGLALLVLIPVLVWLLWPRFAPVPKIIGMDEMAARQAIQDAGFEVGVVGTRTVDTTEAGNAVGQSPPPGIKLAAGSPIDFTIAEPSGVSDATGEAPESHALAVSGAVVPNVIGDAKDEARLRLRTADLGVTVSSQPSGIPIGDVVAQVPAPDTAVAPGTIVHLTLSSGTPSRGSAAVGRRGTRVPNVQGMSASRARSRLTASGFGCRSVYAPSTSTQRGLVFWQSAGPGVDDANPSTVEIWISTGAPDGGFPYRRPVGVSPR